MSLDSARPWKLSIDKISFARFDSSPANAKANCEALVEAFEAGRFAGATLKSSRRHHRQLAIPIGSSKLIIQAGSRFEGVCDYRMELNPALLTPSGVSEVLNILDSAFIEGSKHLLRNSFVTRIDVALDIFGLTADEVVVRSSRHRVHGVFSNRQGVPETLYFGKSKSNQTVVYSKRSLEGVMLRVERRIKPGCRGYQLPQLNDPFNVIQMVDCGSLEALLADMIPEQFFDSVRVRGMTHVLSKVSVHQRRSIKRLLKECRDTILPASEDVWRNWSSLLKASGLGVLVVPAREAKEVELG